MPPRSPRDRRASAWPARARSDVGRTVSPGRAGQVMRDTRWASGVRFGRGPGLCQSDAAVKSAMRRVPTWPQVQGKQIGAALNGVLDRQATRLRHGGSNSFPVLLHGTRRTGLPCEHVREVVAAFLVEKLCLGLPVKPADIEGAVADSGRSYLSEGHLA